METVLYKGTRYAASKPWTPGQPVPEGYKVVFGKLVKMDGASSYHDPSTKAWKATSTAKTPEEHKQAANLHQLASDVHSKAADDFSRMGARSKEKKHMQAMQQHQKQYFKHLNSA